MWIFFPVYKSPLPVSSEAGGHPLIGKRLFQSAEAMRVRDSFLGFYPSTGECRPSLLPRKESMEPVWQMAVRQDKRSLAFQEPPEDQVSQHLCRLLSGF